MIRVEVNAVTGERTEIPFTPEEIAEAQARTEADQRMASISKIEADRDAAFLSGVEWGGRLWHLDATFQAQVTGLVTAYAAGILHPDSTVSIRAMDNTTYHLNADEIKALASAVLYRVQTIWQESWAAKDAARNA